MIVCSLLPGIGPYHAVILSDTDINLLEDFLILFFRPLASQCRSLMGLMKIERCSHRGLTSEHGNKAIYISRLQLKQCNFIVWAWFRFQVICEPDRFYYSINFLFEGVAEKGNEGGTQHFWCSVVQKPGFSENQDSSNILRSIFTWASTLLTFIRVSSYQVSRPIENQTVAWRPPFDHYGQGLIKR